MSSKYPAPNGIAPLLEIVGTIVRGCEAPIKMDYKALLSVAIFPLHNEDQIFQDEIPVISAFHEELVYVLIGYVSKEPSMSPAIIKKLLQMWPKSNSKKEILFLQELEKLLEYLPAPTFNTIATPFLDRLCSCIRHPHFLVAERALQFFKNDYFLSLSREHSPTMVPAVLPSLLDSSHWNPSVNKFAASVVEILEGQDRVVFERAAKGYWEKGDRHTKDWKGATERRLKEMDPARGKAVEEEIGVQVPQKIQGIGYYSLVFGQLLGNGSYSSVRYAKVIQPGTMPSTWPEVAVKIVEKSFIKAQDYQNNIARELQILAKLSHPNIVSLNSVFETEEKIFMVMEYAEKGDLHGWIYNLGSLAEETAKFLIGEVICGLEVVHLNGIIFGDLKPENILIHKTGHVKLTDFGSSLFEKELVDWNKEEYHVERAKEELNRKMNASNQPKSNESPENCPWYCCLCCSRDYFRRKTKQGIRFVVLGLCILSVSGR
eukprot:TRINITY_DN3326_c0_g1_i5.p1 TRINITY_DN3326_c0_g1~~TRINITY_DN3326_c0_g1_i5.p1  ORF type:complete len:488 (+),score=130.00 TRINITY_DN3326_c0_g1_i5:271-1734(+)